MYEMVGEHVAHLLLDELVNAEEALLLVLDLDG
jgi:hypothetical protein